MEVDPLEARRGEDLRETLDRLRLEVEELRAARRRLVLAADADRRSIERDLHDGVQQRLVALAVSLQLAGESVHADPAAASLLLDELARDVQEALDEMAQLVQRIYPPLLEAGGLAAALRSAAVSAGVPAVIEVTAGGHYPPEVTWTVCSCWLDVLGHAGAGNRTITVREEEGSLAFEVVDDADRPAGGLEGLRDRVEALGGRMTIGSDPGGGMRVSASLPLSG